MSWKMYEVVRWEKRGRGDAVTGGETRGGRG